MLSEVNNDLKMFFNDSFFWQPTMNRFQHTKLHQPHTFVTEPVMKTISLDDVLEPWRQDLKNKQRGLVRP
jgi:hypothetical protein